MPLVSQQPVSKPVVPATPQAKQLVDPTPSQPEPHELEMARKMELLAKVRTNREALRNRRRVTGGKPGKVYVWVNKHEGRRMSFETLGYKTCNDPDIKTTWKKSDGTHECGDLVLYEIDKDLHEAIKLDSQLRAVEVIEASTEDFESFASKNRVPVYKGEKALARRQ